MDEGSKEIDLNFDNEAADMEESKPGVTISQFASIEKIMVLKL